MDSRDRRASATEFIVIVVAPGMSSWLLLLNDWTGLSLWFWHSMNKNCYFSVSLFNTNTLHLDLNKNKKNGVKVLGVCPEGTFSGEHKTLWGTQDVSIRESTNKMFLHRGNGFCCSNTDTVATATCVQLNSQMNEATLSPESILEAGVDASRRIGFALTSRLVWKEEMKLKWSNNYQTLSRPSCGVF